MGKDKIRQALIKHIKDAEAADKKSHVYHFALYMIQRAEEALRIEDDTAAYRHYIGM